MSDAPALPPLPESVNIPVQAVEAWSQLPPTTYVTAPLSRADIDNLFFSINRVIESQSETQQCLVEYSTGRLTEANQHMWEARRKLIEAQNNLRQFMTAVMVSASKNSSSHG